MSSLAKVKTISEYRARFTDPNSHNTHTITSNDLDSLQGDIRHALGNTINLETAENSQMIVDKDGVTVLGWISSYQVPQSMSVKNVTQLTRARAA